MLSGLRHGVEEGRRAAALASDAASKKQVIKDFILSRFLKFGRMPNYNHQRQIRLRGQPLCYRFNRGDLQSLKEVWLEEVYRCALPFRATTVLDLGANIGLASVWLARHFRPTHVLAVEPVEANAEIAAKNLLINRVPGAVVTAAVGREEGKAKFVLRQASNVGSISTDALAGDIEVKVQSIQGLLSQLPNRTADLVKMDIEGTERELLRGDLSWLEQVRALIVEFHDTQTVVDELINNVMRAGFRYSPLNEDRQENLGCFVRNS